MDGDKRPATHTGRFIPGDEAPQNAFCMILWIGLTIWIRCEYNSRPCRLSSPGRTSCRHIIMLPDIVMSVEMLVVTDAVDESGMQALMGKRERKKPTGRLRNKCQNNIKIDISRNMIWTWT